MIITTSGTIIRTSVAGISEMGRYTQGVRLIHIREDDEVSTVTEVDRANETDEVETDEEQP
jgi:DNA gyrase subunit A